MLLANMEFDPVSSYERVTGIMDESVMMRDVVGAVMEKVLKESRKEGAVGNLASGASYRYQETDFIRALKYGYLIEIQEPSTITMPGVLVGLNSLLEQGGTITLPNGEIITRHPDAVVVITTNMDYEGCRTLNQSVTDRMDLVLDVPLPPRSVLLQRAMAVTKETDSVMVSNMVDVVYDMSDYCRKNGISDGEVGMRSLISWIMSTKVTKDPYESAKSTVIAKATSSIYEQEELISSFLDAKFAPIRK